MGFSDNISVLFSDNIEIIKKLSFAIFIMSIVYIFDSI